MFQRNCSIFQGSPRADRRETIKRSPSRRSFEDILNLSKKFSLDIPPKLFWTTDSFVELLVSSNISRYCSFRLVRAVATLVDGRIIEVILCSFSFAFFCFIHVTFRFLFLALPFSTKLVSLLLIKGNLCYLCNSVWIPPDRTCLSYQRPPSASIWRNKKFLWFIVVRS